MKLRTLGFIIIVIGLLMIAYTGFIYYTTEKAYDFVGNQIQPKQNLFIEWSPTVSLGLLIGGILIIALNKNRRAY